VKGEKERRESAKVVSRGIEENALSLPNIFFMFEKK
jgi:hypothetical protein